MPEAHLNANDGSIIARMEVGDSIFGGAVDMNFVHAEAELTQAGWNDVIFDFSQPVERWVTSYGRNEYVALSDSVNYDRISIFIDWENGRGATALAVTRPTTSIIFRARCRLSGGYTVPASYILKFEDNFDEIGQAPDAGHWTLETGASGWGNQELQNYTNSTDNSVIVNVGVADGDTDRTDDYVNGALRSPPSVTAERSHRHGLSLILTTCLPMATRSGTSYRPSQGLASDLDAGRHERWRVARDRRDRHGRVVFEVLQ